MSFKWSLNAYTGCVHRCTFCFVRAFEKRADRPFDDRYGTSIRVKTNIVDVLRRELRRPRWAHEPVVIGTATDPYQPAEGRFRLTRRSIEALTEVANPLSIITRGPMIVRDVDVLAEAARRASVSVTFSVPTLDPTIVARTEPGTAPPRQRLRALSTLVDAGIEASVGMAPILPGLSDDPRLLADVVRAARDAGATPSGRTFCISGPEPATTSWTTCRRTGRSCCRATSACTETGPTLRRRTRSRSVARSRICAIDSRSPIAAAFGCFRPRPWRTPSSPCGSNLPTSRPPRSSLSEPGSPRGSATGTPSSVRHAGCRRIRPAPPPRSPRPRPSSPSDRRPRGRSPSRG